jgi:hypothetical protein
VGTKVYLINVPLKVAFVDGDLLLEAHPPVDAQGQTIDPVLSKFEAMLNDVLGNSTTAVNWDIAVDTLKTANGIPVLVGLQADVDPAAAVAAAPTPTVPGEGDAPLVPPPAPVATAPVAPAGSSAPVTTTTQVAPPATESSRWVTQ